MARGPRGIRRAEFKARAALAAIRGDKTQSEALGISLAAVCYVPRPVSEADLVLMRRKDELCLEYLFVGAWTLCDPLRPEGFGAGRKHIGSRNDASEDVIQVWALDITYIQVRRRFVYLVAMVDWANRKNSSLLLSNTLKLDFLSVLKHHHITLSMDGGGCWRDNVIIERLWKTLKYQEVYLRAYETVSETRDSIGRYVEFYNGHRPHRVHKGRTPDAAYFGNEAMKAAA